MGLVGKTRCPQMHGVSLSPQYNAGKGDRESQLVKASAAPFPAVPCRDETSLGSAMTRQAQVLALKAPSPGGNSKKGCGCSSSLGKSNLALLVLMRVEPGPLRFGCPWSSCSGCRSGSLWLTLKVHGFIHFWCRFLWKREEERNRESWLCGPGLFLGLLQMPAVPALSQSFWDLDSLFFGSFSFQFPSGLVFIISFCRAIKGSLFKLILEQQIVLT